MRRTALVIAAATMALSACAGTKQNDAAAPRPSVSQTPTPTPSNSSAPSSSPESSKWNGAKSYASADALANAAGLTNCSPMPIAQGASSEWACDGMVNVWTFASEKQQATFINAQATGSNQPRWLWGPSWAIEASDRGTLQRAQRYVGGLL